MRYIQMEKEFLSLIKMKNNLKPLFVIIAGPNGSGKSTLKKRLELGPDFPQNYINADEIKKTKLVSDEDARKIAEQQCNDALNRREPFAFETVFSHPSKIELMEKAKEAGYWVELHFVCLQDAALNVERVRGRHAIGGHNVPEDKVISRYPRSMKQLTKALPLADEAMIYDNSWESHVMIARKTRDNIIHIYPLNDKEPKSIWTKQEIEKLLGYKEVLQDSKKEVLQSARKELKEDSFTVNPKPGVAYEGEIISKNEYYAVQKVSDMGILHELDKVPGLRDRNVGENLTIEYGGGDTAKIADKANASNVALDEEYEI